MIVTTKTRNLTVLSVPDGKQVLAVPLPHNLTPYPALLADAGNHTWLLVLRDGIKFEAYRSRKVGISVETLSLYANPVSRERMGLLTRKPTEFIA